MKRILIRAALCTGCLLAVGAGSVLLRAEDVEKKFRVGLAVGQYHTEDSVPSDSANFLILVDENGVPERFFEDPRNDNAAIGTLGIKPAFRAVASAQYAFTKIFVLEGSLGYQKGDVGDIETQAQFEGEGFPTVERFRFHIFRVKAGELTQIPLELTAMARFRPKATLNPYIGAGVGYTFIGFDPSSELNRLSANIDNSTGIVAKVLSLDEGAGFADTGSTLDLTGARVDARDTFAWHMAGGFEYTFRKKWAAFLDLRYTFASRSFDIGFNGSSSIGVSVRQGEEDLPPGFSADFSAMHVPAGSGGFVDVGRLVPIADAPPGTECPEGAARCFVFLPDGVPDAGYYYVQGGEIKYGGPSLKLGIRYTF